MRALLRRARKAAVDARNQKCKIADSLLFDISSSWNRILIDAIAFHKALPPLPTKARARPKRRPGHNCALRLSTRKADCLRVLYDPDVPFANNAAERDLRMVKLQQKVSGGFRTSDGADSFATLRSVIHTARKQDWNVLDTLAHPNPTELIPKLHH